MQIKPRSLLPIYILNWDRLYSFTHVLKLTSNLFWFVPTGRVIT